jgi:hypothetical protein
MATSLNVLDAAPQQGTVITCHHVINQSTKAITQPLSMSGTII